MALVLALTAAVSWGASDFLGGLAGRRADGEITVATSFTTQFIGLLGLSAIALAVGGTMTSADVWNATAAGLGGAVGVALLYRGLTVGKMGVVAPVTGAGAATIPVVYGISIGEIPSAPGWLGMAAALVAIVLVSREPAPVHDGPGPPTDGAFRGWRTPGLLEALGAGLGFGLIFILLDRTSEASNLLALIPMKIAASALLATIGLASRRPLVPPRTVWGPVLGVGVLDNLANVAYLLATRNGLIALVAVVSSLYPVGTVLLARAVLDERLARHQVGGLGLAATGVALIAVG